MNESLGGIPAQTAKEIQNTNPPDIGAYGGRVTEGDGDSDGEGEDDGHSSHLRTLINQQKRQWFTSKPKRNPQGISVTETARPRYCQIQLYNLHQLYLSQAARAYAAENPGAPGASGAKKKIEY